MEQARLLELLEQFHDKYNHRDLIPNDPVSIPHQFSKKQDVEIMGFFAAIMAWGLRITTINKCNELATLMDHAPHDFILHHQERDLKRLEDFKHRTFNSTDLLYFIAFFKWYYSGHNSLQEVFIPTKSDDGEGQTMKGILTRFHQLFFSLEYAPSRTKKHIANPAKNATCKRLNMYLRWMVRSDGRGFDLGIWKTIPKSILMCPIDVHVERSARKLGLISRKQRDWKTVEELTANLRRLNPEDPVKYDFALFGMGLEHY